MSLLELLKGVKGTNTKNCMRNPVAESVCSPEGRIQAGIRQAEIKAAPIMALRLPMNWEV